MYRDRVWAHITGARKGGSLRYLTFHTEIRMIDIHDLNRLEPVPRLDETNIQ